MTTMENERDKKFAQKFLVKDLPHPFKNVK